ncbi:uncharacterized protein V1510DRAFT_415320 [Dipodascopsis tothii]|uniref:uncharacterized protein n=1 Tax=Dipodascopsis tothii TaxID=44089 RepID=UPI0034CF49D3
MRPCGALIALPAGPAASSVAHTTPIGRYPPDDPIAYGGLGATLRATPHRNRASGRDRAHNCFRQARRCPGAMRSYPNPSSESNVPTGNDQSTRRAALPRPFARSPLDDAIAVADLTTLPAAAGYKGGWFAGVEAINQTIKQSTQSTCLSSRISRTLSRTRWAATRTRWARTSSSRASSTPTTASTASRASSSPASAPTRTRTASSRATARARTWTRPTSRRPRAAPAAPTSTARRRRPRAAAPRVVTSTRLSRAPPSRALLRPATPRASPARAGDTSPRPLAARLARTT